MAWGGKRAGAGRPRKAPCSLEQLASEASDPLKFLLDVMQDEKMVPALRVRAAIAAAQYTHAKKGEGGKKDERQDAAEKAAGGRFKPARAPKLVVAGGKLVDGVS